MTESLDSWKEQVQLQQALSKNMILHYIVSTSFLVHLMCTLIHHVILCPSRCGTKI
jgi:hypothetical protein